MSQSHPPASTASKTPRVSYVLPVLNEESRLPAAIHSILKQDYDGYKEILIALAPSKDNTAKIAHQLAKADRRIRVIENPCGATSTGLNRALKAASGEIIVRVDAHATLNRDYTGKAIAALQKSGAALVGGIMRAHGETPWQQAIAACYNSPVGLGGGRYHGDKTAGPSESAYLGVFQREWLTRVGGYSESILRGEDWELSLRIRKAGGLVLFDPALKVTYYPRDSIALLGKQFYATGAWRAILVRKYPREHPWRFFAPGILVTGFAANIFTLTASIFSRRMFKPAILLLAGPLIYFTLITVFASRIAGSLSEVMKDRRKVLTAARITVTLTTMHFCWGAGFLRALFFGARKIVDKSRVKR